MAKARRCSRTVAGRTGDMAGLSEWVGFGAPGGASPLAGIYSFPGSLLVPTAWCSSSVPTFSPEYAMAAVSRADIARGTLFEIQELERRGAVQLPGKGRIRISPQLRARP